MYVQGLHNSGPFWQLHSWASICLSPAEPVFSGQANTTSSCTPLSFPNRISTLQGSKWLEMTHRILHRRYGKDVPLTMMQTKPGTRVSVLWLRALAPVNSQFKFQLISWESLEELSNGMTLQMKAAYLLNTKHSISLSPPSNDGVTFKNLKVSKSNRDTDVSQKTRWH